MVFGEKLVIQTVIVHMLITLGKSFLYKTIILI